MPVNMRDGKERKQLPSENSELIKWMNYAEDKLVTGAQPSRAETEGSPGLCIL